MTKELLEQVATMELRDQLEAKEQMIKNLICKLRDVETDCNTLCNKLLQTNPDLEEWLEKHYGEYL
jgi:hypothetical protein